MKKLFHSSKILLFSAFMFTPVVAKAANLQNAIGNLGRSGQLAYGETPQSDLGIIVGTVINIALSMVGLIFLVLMVYAGFLWMTARGDEGAVEKAQKIVSRSVIGLVIVVSAYAITVLVTRAFQ